MIIIVATSVWAINITILLILHSQVLHHACTGQTMLKALIFGLAISCLLLGIECLAVEQIKLAQGDSRIVVIPEILGWLLIGIGSSTTLYTLINRSSSPARTDVKLDTSTTINNGTSDSHHQWDTTDYDLTEHYDDYEEDDDAHEGHDRYDEEDYLETVDQDESEPEFDLQKFNQQFDIDELLEE